MTIGICTLGSASIGGTAFDVAADHALGPRLVAVGAGGRRSRRPASGDDAILRSHAAGNAWVDVVLPWGGE